MYKLRDTPPSDKIYKNMCNKAKELWMTYDDTYGYATEKIQQIPNENVGSNFMYIWNMFDSNNQAYLLSIVHEDTKQAILDRLE